MYIENNILITNIFLFNIICGIWKFVEKWTAYYNYLYIYSVRRCCWAAVDIITKNIVHCITEVYTNLTVISTKYILVLWLIYQNSSWFLLFVIKFVKKFVINNRAAWKYFSPLWGQYWIFKSCLRFKTQKFHHAALEYWRSRCFLKVGVTPKMGLKWNEPRRHCSASHFAQKS